MNVTCKEVKIASALAEHSARYSRTFGEGQYRMCKHQKRSTRSSLAVYYSTTNIYTNNNPNNSLQANKYKLVNFNLAKAQKLPHYLL